MPSSRASAPPGRRPKPSTPAADRGRPEPPPGPSRRRPSSWEDAFEYSALMPRCCRVDVASSAKIPPLHSLQELVTVHFPW
ncbi:MAG: hypothetical protein ACK56F_24915 [bacterium]